LAGKSEKLIEHLFRSEYGKLLATLTRYFGPSNFQLAEDVLQETMIAALNNWGTSGIPSNPAGWLVQVAKRKALNEMKRNAIMQRHSQSEDFTNLSGGDIGSFFLDDEIKDNQLRMIFACCHSSLDIKSQIALTLKTLCGFGVKEVAHALLTSESTINKKLYRAKEKIRNSQIPFSIPPGKELHERLETVGLTMYLFFNEGYNSSIGETIVQKELCLEAIRLTKLLVDHFQDKYRLAALLALMCFHTSRFDARMDNNGAIVLLEDQDRSLWNKDLIHIGMHYLQMSLRDATLSTYHIEARIAAEHCLSDNFQDTDWEVIRDQYLLLEQLKPNPIIQLNLAIVESKLQGVEASLAMLEKLTRNEELRRYHLLPAIQGILYMKLKNYSKAKEFLGKSLKLKPAKREIAFIETKILECEKLLPTK
jgi:RNA polymerase sigma-70 factor (ECF subfamily)